MYVLHIYLICTTIYLTRAQDAIIFALLEKDMPMSKLEADIYYINDKVETVDINVYYECLCPDCIRFDRDQFKKVVEQLAPYLNVHTYPYGNAQTIEHDGKVEFKCQHGPDECYGNKLHACALNHIVNNTEAVLFNFCLMDPRNGSRGSDDLSAKKCGGEMDISVMPILECAKGEQGTQLLKYYGEESQKINFDYVPYILLNGNKYFTADDKIWVLQLKDSENYVEENKVNVKVYYETLCPASISFVISQLRPVVEALPSRVNISLVPYGHARTHVKLGRYLFRCQHGSAECYGNMVHACVVDAMQNNTKAVLFNACLMEYTIDYYNYKDDYVSILNWCSYKLNLLMNGVWECINNNRSSILLKRYGEETHALRPKYVPYVTMDGSSYNQDRLVSNLMSMVCGKLQPTPQSCHRYL